MFDYILRLFEHDFPSSYALDFRSPNKEFLPIKGLPKKGVNQMFANACSYPSVHKKMEKYARTVMKEFEWYNNLNAEHSAMPGTFAVFALGLYGGYSHLVIDYLTLCDGEHSEIQGKFMFAYIGKFGFTTSTIKAFIACACNIQELPHKKIYLEAIDNITSLQFLLEQKLSLEDYNWRGVLYAIFGQKNLDEKGARIIKKANAELRPIYEQIFDEEK